MTHGHGMYPCPCGASHPAPTVWSGDGQTTTTIPDEFLSGTIIISLPNGSWKVPRIWVAVHGLAGWDLPTLAAEHGWERVDG